jgi:hypothetical protein
MRKLMVTWVRQEDEWGCFIAAMAMVTGKTYAQVKAETGETYTNKSASYYSTDQYLTQNGYAYARLWSFNQFAQDADKNNVPMEPWPPKPFAPVHVCLVTMSMGHFVVMLADGTVFDPTVEAEKKLTDYERVNWVAGVWPISWLRAAAPKEK